MRTLMTHTRRLHSAVNNITRERDRWCVAARKNQLDAKSEEPAGGSVLAEVV